MGPPQGHLQRLLVQGVFLDVALEPAGGFVHVGDGVARDLGADGGNVALGGLEQAHVEHHRVFAKLEAHRDGLGAVLVGGELLPLLAQLEDVP